MAIWFHSEYPGFDIFQKRKLKRWISSVIEEEKFTLGNINYSFLSDEELLNINLKFLKHNFYTDIISFDYSKENIISGDIYISIDRIKENSKEFETPFERELERVIIHGVLHFLGFKDKSKTQIANMRKAELKCLLLLNTTNE